MKTKIRAVLPVLLDQRRVLLEILVYFSDKSAVVALQNQRSQGRPVHDAVLRRHFPGGGANAPFVATVPEVGEAGIGVGFQPGANQRPVRAIAVAVNGTTPVGTVQNHMDVAVCQLIIES